MIPLGNEVNEKKKNQIDISEYEDVEDDDDYTPPVVLAYDTEDED